MKGPDLPPGIGGSAGEALRAMVEWATPLIGAREARESEQLVLLRAQVAALESLARDLKDFAEQVRRYSGQS